MQSFSNLTEKQAEHSRIMWFSYFIVALLLGLMVLWWLQEPAQVVDENVPQSLRVITQQKANSSEQKAAEQQTTEQQTAGQSSIELVKPAAIQPEETIVEQEVTKLKEQELIELKEQELKLTIKEIVPEIIEESVAALSTAVFTFSGDCWVNIYDATGERIAWGVKKSGYVMTITGKAPLKITLGKPELAAIVFDGQAIDISVFNVGNIAKFTLPLNL